jgi:suppressor of G2 allele of SKP1
MAVQSNSVPQYPTSSKVKKDWSKVDNEIEKDLSKEKPEGDAALNDLFKQIYGRADEATRRAMIKSY